MIASTAVSVGTSATALAAVASGARDIYVQVPAGGVDVYVGGSDVTTANGLVVTAAGSVLPLGPLQGGDQIFGRVASGTQEVRVLVVD